MPMLDISQGKKCAGAEEGEWNKYFKSFFSSVSMEKKCRGLSFMSSYIGTQGWGMGI